MAAKVESMGGTTLEMTIPSTASILRFTGENRLCNKMPHSSAVCLWTVRSRHWQSSLLPSKAPIVMLLLPASRASSTYASRNNQSIGSIVLAHYQEPVRIEAGGDAANHAAGLLHLDAAAGGITGGLREEAQDGGRVVCEILVGGAQQRGYDGLARNGLAGGSACPTFFTAQRSGFARQLGRKRFVIHVDANAGDGLNAGQLHQNAGDFPVGNHHVVGPAQIAGDAAGFGDGILRRQSQRQSENRRRRQHQRAIDSRSEEHTSE